MILDFKDIPAGNTGGDGQDQFELFSRDFCKAIGFKIVQHPSRGADRKKDMIVSGKFEGTKDIWWLVSCKHNAHSKTRRAVNDTDESDLITRLVVNKCKGFIGIYSTIATPNLSNNLHDLRNKYQSEVFDHRRIEDYIFEKVERHHLVWRYFENSYNKHKDKFKVNQPKNNMKSPKSKTATTLTEDDILRISMTAIILIELEKIKQQYANSNWDKRADTLGELYKYSDHTNLKIAEAVFSFLSNVADGTRSGMTSEVALSVFSLALDFFPYSESPKDKKKIIELGNQCANIAFSMVYDTTIHRQDYNVAMYGLTILKYIYKKGKELKLKALIDKVNETYHEIEETLKRPERNDLGNAKDLVKAFRDDIEKGTLSFPYLPDHLMKLIYADKK